MFPPPTSWPSRHTQSGARPAASPPPPYLATSRKQTPGGTSAGEGGCSRRVVAVVCLAYANTKKCSQPAKCTLFANTLLPITAVAIIQRHSHLAPVHPSLPDPHGPHLASQSLGKLQRQVAEAADADDANRHARAPHILLERRVDGQAST
eukprot:364804-Chlamydomonas_euryale.AAC.7